jgi:hypothetical protein
MAGQQESAMSTNSKFDASASKRRSVVAYSSVGGRRHSTPKSQDGQADNTEGRPTVESAIDYGSSEILEKVVWLF